MLQIITIKNCSKFPSGKKRVFQKLSEIRMEKTVIFDMNTLHWQDPGKQKFLGQLVRSTHPPQGSKKPLLGSKTLLKKLGKIKNRLNQIDTKLTIFKADPELSGENLLLQETVYH